ncbi:MAG: tetratricopeptide repeat protein [Isosphaeraceae bacterium]
MEPAVVSITGLVTAVPDDSLPEFLGHLTWNRERLAGYNHRQIWWMTPSFVDAFIHTVPDLASWFMVRLTLSEEFIPPIQGPQTIEPIRSEGSKYRIDEAMRRATSLVERFLRAKEVGSSTSNLIGLATSAADAIVEVGAPNLTKELADRFLRDAVPTILENHRNDFTTLRSFNSFVALLLSQGRTREGEQLVQDEIAIVKGHAIPEHPDVARDLRNLARLLKGLNRFEEAEPLIRHALMIDERVRGLNHPDVANDLSNLAFLLCGTKRLGEAETLFRRALAIDEQFYGTDHPDVAIDLLNLAFLLENTNRLSEAMPLLHRALAIDERVYGSEHPVVARDLNNLALVQVESNNLRKAEPLFRRSLEINERAYGPDHPNNASVLKNLADLFLASNRSSESESLYRRALDIWEKNLGIDHLNMASAIQNLAELLRSQHRLSEAEPLFRRMLEILLKFTTRGFQHPFLRNAIANYVGTLEAMGQSPEQIRARLDEIGRPFGMSLDD